MNINTFLGMMLMGKFLHTIIVLNKEDKSLKLDQLFRVISSFSPSSLHNSYSELCKQPTFKRCDIFKTMIWDNIEIIRN